MHEIVSILEVTGTSPADNFKLWVTPVDSLGFCNILSNFIYKMGVSISMSVSGKVIWLGKRPSDHDQLLTKSCTDEGDRSTK